MSSGVSGADPHVPHNAYHDDAPAAGTTHPRLAVPQSPARAGPGHARPHGHLFQSFISASAPPLADARAARRFLGALAAIPDRLGALWELISGHKCGLKRLNEVLNIALPVPADCTVSVRSAGARSGGELLLELLEAVCVERMVRPSRLQPEPDRALQTIYSKVCVM